MGKANWIYFSLCVALGSSLAAHSQAGSLGELEALVGLSGDQYSLAFDGELQRAASVPAPAAPVAPPNASGQSVSKQQMLDNLDMIRSIISASYAPAGWKKEQFGWDLETEIEKARHEVSQGNLAVREYQKIVSRLFQSMRDYHVSVQFAQTEYSSLPFTVMGADGKYFITGINRAKLPESSFPFKVGDELVAFDSTPVSFLIQGLKKELGASSPLTDSALAAIFLTSRSASKAMEVSHGPVVITVKPAGSQQTVTRQLIWDYSPEAIQLKARPGEEKAKLRIPLAWLNDASWAGADGLPAAGEASYGIGARNSFVPELGPVIWQSEEENPFHAYIYRSADNKVIGYVRIPTYGTRNPETDLAAFARIIIRFKASTDGLVIDQVNNPGGSVFYLYTLASMLSNQALATPRHRISLDQDDIMSAARFLRYDTNSDEGAKEILGKTLGGYPMSYEVFRHMKEFNRFVLDQWNAGKRLTDPTYIYGVAHINPSPVVNYDKPILLLVNELDFSGGDFFPAIMQDNKRATIFGTRTSGAGGYIKRVSYPNQLGIDSFSLTGSIAYRSDGSPLENLGVTPDIKYAPGAADFQDGFKDYAKAVNAAVSGLLK